MAFTSDKKPLEPKSQQQDITEKTECDADKLEDHRGEAPLNNEDPHATQVTVLYWNHGRSDYSQVPIGVHHSSEAKAELFLRSRIIGRFAKPEVVVIAEMRSKKARKIVENYGFNMVRGREVDLDHIAIFVRNDIQYEFVHDGDRWITAKVKGTLVTGVHLRRSLTHYPALARDAFGEGAMKGKYVVIGDFNRDPRRLIETLPATAAGYTASRCDHLVFHCHLRRRVETGLAPELERLAHPWIYASFE